MKQKYSRKQTICKNYQKKLRFIISTFLEKLTVEIFYKLKIFTKVHGNNLRDSVTEFLFVNVVVVLQHLRAPGQREEGGGVGEFEIRADLL